MSFVPGSARKRLSAWRRRPADFARHGHQCGAPLGLDCAGRATGEGGGLDIAAATLGARAAGGAVQQGRATGTVQQTAGPIDGAGGGLSGGGWLGSRNPDTTPCNSLPTGACDRAFEWVGLRAGVEDGAHGGISWGRMIGSGRGHDGECGMAAGAGVAGVGPFAKVRRDLMQQSACWSLPAGSRSGGAATGRWGWRGWRRGPFAESRRDPMQQSACWRRPPGFRSDGAESGCRGWCGWRDVGLSRKSDRTPCNSLLAGAGHRGLDQVGLRAGVEDGAGGDVGLS